MASASDSETSATTSATALRRTTQRISPGSARGRGTLSTAPRRRMTGGGSGLIALSRSRPRGPARLRGRNWRRAPRRPVRLGGAAGPAQPRGAARDGAGGRRARPRRRAGCAPFSDRAWRRWRRRVSAAVNGPHDRPGDSIALQVSPRSSMAEVPGVFIGLQRPPRPRWPQHPRDGRRIGLHQNPGRSQHRHGGDHQSHEHHDHILLRRRRSRRHRDQLHQNARCYPISEPVNAREHVRKGQTTKGGPDRTALSTS
jgi:hypothetical protein